MGFITGADIVGSPDDGAGWDQGGTMEILDLNPRDALDANGCSDAESWQKLADVGVPWLFVSGSLEDQGWIRLKDAARLAGMTPDGLKGNVQRNSPELLKRVEVPGKQAEVYIHRDADKIQRALRQAKNSGSLAQSARSVWPKNLSQVVEDLIDENRRLMAERDAAEREVKVKGDLLERFLPPPRHGGNQQAM